MNILGQQKRIEETKQVLVYYANAYHSWERGTNENHKKQIRRYIPKKSDIGEISQNPINKIGNKINLTKQTNYKNY